MLSSESIYFLYEVGGDRNLLGVRGEVISKGKFKIAVMKSRRKS